MSRVALLVSLFVLPSPSLASAQTPAGLEPGKRVRVAHRCKVAGDKVIECHMSRSPRFDTGPVHSLDQDTLRIRGQSFDAALAIPRASIAELWVSERRKGNFKAGAFLGLLAGAAIGAVIESGSEFCFVGSCAPLTAFGAIVGAPMGLLIGGIVGSDIQSERWRRLPVEHIGMSPGPRPDTLGLGISLAF